MTIIAWDGETLAADSYVYDGDIVFETNFNKVQKVDVDIVFSLAGSYYEYQNIIRQFEGGADILDVKVDGNGDDSTVILFTQQEPDYYWVNDGGWYKRDIRKPIVIGAASEYAKGLLDSNIVCAEDIVKLCTKNHSGCGGRVNKLKIAEYFGW